MITLEIESLGWEILSYSDDVTFAHIWALLRGEGGDGGAQDWGQEKGQREGEDGWIQHFKLKGRHVRTKWLGLQRLLRLKRKQTNWRLNRVKIARFTRKHHLMNRIFTLISQSHISNCYATNLPHCLIDMFCPKFFGHMSISPFVKIACSTWSQVMSSQFHWKSLYFCQKITHRHDNLA